MKLAFLTTDNREPHRRYDLTSPYFGTAPESVLQGFADLGTQVLESGNEPLEVHVLSCTKQPMVSPEKLAPNIWFHSLHVPKLGWLRTGYQGCVRAVRGVLKEIQPDIVHGQGTERDCSLSAIFSGFPNVITLHGNMRVIAKIFHARPFSYHWLAARLEDFTLPRSDGVVCITNYTRREVSAKARRTWVVPNAADRDFFKVSSAPIDPPLILCVGNVDERKNQNAFIDALQPLAATRPFRVLFLGGLNKERPYGVAFMQRIEANPWCEYAGFAGREKLREYFGQASLVALPSHEDNCPMVVLEAMAAGLPVLASNVGGVPELIEAERTGLLCDPQHPESFRDGVARLLEGSGLAQRLAVAAKKEALQRFHPQVIAQRHLEIYQEVLKTSS